MRGMKRRFRESLGSAGLVLAALCLVLTPAFAQNSSAQHSPGVKTGPVPIVGNFDKVKAIAARRTHAPHGGRASGPDRTLVSQHRGKNAAGCLPGR